MNKPKKKFKKFHPAYIYLVLTLIMVIISGIFGNERVKTNYSKIDHQTQQVELKSLEIENLLNRTGVQYFVGNILTNFVNFAPLAMLIVGLIGIGVVYKSGFLDALIAKTIKKIPKKMVTFLIVLLGIISSLYVESGYVMLLPISAIVFLSLNRNPILGLCAAFSGISFGYGANLIVNSLDSSLIPYTNAAARVIASNYNVALYGNLSFIIVATFCLAYVGMFITEKIIVLKLGKYEVEQVEEKVYTKEEQKAFTTSMIVWFVLIIIFAYAVFPNLPFSGLFLNMREKTYLNQLFGEKSYINQGFIFLSSFSLIIVGMVYGYLSKNFKNNADLIQAMGSEINNSGHLYVLIFFASQFIEITKKINIGPFLASVFANLLDKINVTGSLLILVVLLILFILNLILPNTVAKWMILSPVVVPKFMKNSMSPEFAQLVFRVGDSLTKGITPVFAYFVIFLGFVLIYNDKRKIKTTMSGTLKLMLPYTIGYSIVWITLVFLFYLIGIPIGIGVYPLIG